jgi:hypothetical protein
LVLEAVAVIVGLDFTVTCIEAELGQLMPEELLKAVSA